MIDKLTNELRTLLTNQTNWLKAIHDENKTSRLLNEAIFNELRAIKEKLEEINSSIEEPTEWI
ncbi:MAG: hypothetical protein KKB31_05985 [Nanoarchaeota archaeon]|nr:hypothetical protein [Nanoarchaeota archaeon]